MTTAFARRSLLAITALALFCFSCLSSANTSPANTSLWIAESSGILKIALADEAVLFELTEAEGVEALSVDSVGGRVWAYGRGRLKAYTVKGVLEVDVAVPEMPENAAVTEMLADTGGVWMAARSQLFRFDEAGQLQKLLDFSKPVTAMTLDVERQQLWAAVPEQVVILNGSGAEVATFHPPFPRIDQMEYDAYLDNVWLSGGPHLFRLDAGQPDREFMAEKGAGERFSHYLSADGQGGVWGGTRQEISHVNSRGDIEFTFRPFHGRKRQNKNLQDLVADPEDGSVWLANPVSLQQYSVNGALQREFIPDLGDGVIRAINHLGLEKTPIEPPAIDILAPVSGSFINNPIPVLSLSYSSSGEIDTASVEVSRDDRVLETQCTADQTQASCQLSTPLPDGEVTLEAVVADSHEQRSEAATVTFTIDTVAPVIDLGHPEAGLFTNQPELTIQGALSEPVISLSLETGSAFVSLPVDSTSFSHTLSLTEGGNRFELHARDRAGNTATLSRNVTLDTMPPAVPVSEGIHIELDAEEGLARITGEAGSVEPDTWVRITNTRTGESVIVRSDAEGAFVAELPAEPGDSLHIEAEDLAGNRSESIEQPVSSIPPDPARVAPSLSDTSTTPMDKAVAFLYTGNHPIQRGVAEGTIEKHRVAVIRGQVRTREGEPLEGVRIQVHKHPELGETLTRMDGAFDMAVNGGGALNVEYQKEGYLPVQRKIQAPWKDYAWVDDVVMVALDNNATPIDLGQTTEYQIARGSEEQDDAGRRQATLMFPAGVGAEMVLPDGSRTPLSSATVRATEYTVGANGFNAMPGELPPTSAYTYAVELSVDEAIEAGAERVDFTQAIPLYVDNFLDFPTGEIVPTGYYDRQAAAWRAGDNGRIIEILSIEGGLARLDTTGDGQEATRTQLDQLGITDAELEQLALLYTEGKILWRTPIRHFTPWDCNWPFGPPGDAVLPVVPEPQTNDEDEPENSKEDCKKPGCIISALSQTLGEQIPVTGTPFDLVYSSDRTEGYGRSSADIQLSGDDLPASLEGIQLEVSIAGQRFSKTFDAAPNQSYTFEWDGLDGYGRQVRGSQKAQIKVSFLYPCVYQSADPNVTRAWARTGNISAIGTRSNCQSTVLSRDWTLTLESVHKLRPETVGAWSLDAHHVYDPQTQSLSLGTGERRDLASRSITTVAGTGEAGYSGDGGPAVSADLYRPRGIALGADGSVYFSTGHKVRRIDPQGNIFTVAGTGEAGFSGDNGAATLAQLNTPRGLAVTESGGLYIADSRNYRVRFVSPEGLITTVAGNGRNSFAGDEGPATQASLSRLQGVTLGPVSGSFYIADTYDNSRVRYVDPDGMISMVTHIPNRPYDMAVNAEGVMYVLDTYQRRILKISSQGEVEPIAGGGNYGTDGEGVPATSIDLSGLSGMTLGPDQSIYFAEVKRGKVRRVDPEGIITTVAGTGVNGFSGDGGAADKAQLNRPVDVVVAPNGAVYFTDSGNHRIRRVSSMVRSAPGIEGIVIPSSDGTLVYQFDASGRHLTTRDAVTGATVYSFDYDTDGRLIQVTDSDQNTPPIERGADGRAQAIVAPDGQRTELATNSLNHLTAITDPAGNVWAMSYTDKGLMVRFQNPNQHINRFTYNSHGRLIQDEAPNGGGWQIERTRTEEGHRTDMTSGEGRLSRYSVRTDILGQRYYRDQAPDGTVTERTVGPTSSTVKYPSGTVIKSTQGPDPRFGLSAPVPVETTVATPAGLTSTTRVARQAHLENTYDLFSHNSLTETRTVNGRTGVAHYETATNRWTRTSPQGRSSITQLNDKGRVTRRQVAALAPLNYHYDERGRLSEVVAANPDAGESSDPRRTRLDYDALGNIASVTDALERSVHFEYDPAGRVTRQTGPDGRRTDFDYDGNGNLRLLQPPGREAHLFDYNESDLEEAYKPPALARGTTVTRYQYNLDKQLTEIQRPDGQSVNLAYDTGGRLSQVTMPHGSLHYSYQPDSGQLATLTAPDGGQLHWTYDGHLPRQESWTGTITGSLSRRYDNNFWVRGLTVNGVEVTFDYDSDGLLTRAGSLSLEPDPDHGLLRSTHLNSVSTGNDYSVFGELSHHQATVNGATLYSTDFQRDALGRITEKSETIEGDTHNHRYHYDEAGRLARVEKDGNTTDTYHYDANGNRLSHNGTSATYDEQDRLLSYGEANYNYTEAGELKSRTENGRTTTFDYDVMGNLRKVQLADDTSISYKIDGRNRRIGKLVNGELVQGFLYQDQLNPVAELDGSGNVVARFVYAEKINVPAYMVKGGTTYRILSDHLGSPRLVIDTATGAIAQRLDYDAFGQVIRDTNPGFQPFGFAGGIYDQHTGLVRFGARDYAPEVGMWTAKDPIRFAGGDANLYGYVLNDPINLNDPSGLIVCKLLSILGDQSINLGAGIGGGLGISGDLNLSASGIIGSTTIGAGLGVSTSASIVTNASFNLGDTGRDFNFGSSVAVGGGSGFGGRATLSSGTSGVTVSGSFGFGLGASFVTGLGISGSILNCEVEKPDDCSQ